MLNIENINHRFEKAGEIILRHRALNLLLLLLLVIFSVAGLKQLKTDVNMDKWFMEDDVMLKTKERFEKIFGNNDYCAILVESENVFTPKVLRSIRELGEELIEKVPYAQEIISLANFEFSRGTADGIQVINIVPDPVPETVEGIAKIRRRAFSKPLIKNRIVSEDGRYAWIMLRMNSYPDPADDSEEQDPSIAVGRAVNRVIAQEKYKHLSPRSTGLPVINLEKKDFFSKETPRMLGFSMILTVLVLALALRSVRGVIFPLITSVAALVIVFGVQGFLGIKFDPSMVFLPLFLGLAVSIGYSIHIFNAFEQALETTRDRNKALVQAIRRTGWPLLFSALTTLTALFSFLFIPLRPVRWIGMTAAALVGLTYVLVLVLLPSLLSFGGVRKKKKKSVGTFRVVRLMETIDRWVKTHPRAIITVFASLIAACTCGIMLLEVSFDIRRTYGDKIPYVKRITEIGDTAVGSMYSYDVAFEFPEAGAVKDPQVLKKFQRIEEEVKSFRLTKKVTSVLDIIRDMNQVVNGGDPAYYALPDTRAMVAQLLLLYENAGGSEVEKWVDYDYRRLRLMVDVTDYNSKTAGEELTRIRALGKELFPEAEVALIGSLSQFTAMMNYITWGQLKSFFIALGVISLLMSAVFGSIRTGLIAMVPNLTPAFTVGGLMGFLHIPLDMMTVTIIPMLLGLAVDDTIHFINDAELSFRKTRSYDLAISHVFRSVGVALFLTSVVLVANFSAFISSPARVFVNMGILVSTGIISALMADYFITPVMIRRFKPFGPEGHKEETVPAPLAAPTVSTTPYEQTGKAL